MKNNTPTQIMNRLIEEYKIHHFRKSIDLAIEIFENELEFLINTEKYHCRICDDRIKDRISNLKQALEDGKRSLE